jgi:cytochrome c oxidase cbb3-type subunit 3
MNDIKDKNSGEVAPPPGTEMHVYDGIVEHDNFLPRWWLGILYGTVLFAIGYFVYYTMGPGPTLVQEYQTEIDRRQMQLALQPKADGSTGMDDATLLEWSKSPEHINLGKAVYDGKCSVCHGTVGQGGIGPNLTDDHWIHGVKASKMAAVVANGVSDKGMPPWGSLLSTDDQKSVVAYVRSLHGTNPPNPKTPQGEKVAFE